MSAGKIATASKGSTPFTPLLHVCTKPHPSDSGHLLCCFRGCRLWRIIFAPVSPMHTVSIAAANNAPGLLQPQLRQLPLCSPPAKIPCTSSHPMPQRSLTSAGGTDSMSIQDAGPGLGLPHCSCIWPQRQPRSDVTPCPSGLWLLLAAPSQRPPGCRCRGGGASRCCSAMY